MATYLLGIENIKQIKRDQLRGFLIENMVILELIKARVNHGLEPQLYYYRDNHQNEVDLIYKHANELIPIEIKSSQTFTNDFLKGLKFYQDLVTPRAQKGYVVYTGDFEQKIRNFSVINYKHASKIIDENI